MSAKGRSRVFFALYAGMTTTTFSPCSRFMFGPVLFSPLYIIFEGFVLTETSASELREKTSSRFPVGGVGLSEIPARRFSRSLSNRRTPSRENVQAPRAKANQPSPNYAVNAPKTSGLRLRRQGPETTRSSGGLMATLKPSPDRPADFKQKSC